MRGLLPFNLPEGEGFISQLSSGCSSSVLAFLCSF
jgi:hypothetical protein